MPRRRDEWYGATETTPGMSLERKRAVEALKVLRRASAPTSRPYRAASLAEAEAVAGLFERDGQTSVAMIREHGLTGKYKARVATPREHGKGTGNE